MHCRHDCQHTDRKSNHSPWVIICPKTNSYEQLSVIEQKATMGTSVGKDTDYIGGRLPRLSRWKMRTRTWLPQAITCPLTRVSSIIRSCTSLFLAMRRVAGTFSSRSPSRYPCFVVSTECCALAAEGRAHLIKSPARHAKPTSSSSYSRCDPL
jgi:hypothetical protein